MIMDELFLYLLVAFIIHCCLLFFDVVFKSCSHYPYLYFLSNTGLQIFPFKIHWFTTAFNRLIQKWGAKRPKLQTAWFTAGTWVSIIIMPISIFLIFHTTYITTRNTYHEEKGSLIVEPLIPGWNLPSSDCGYYLVTLLIASIVHEIGHAMAAVREDVHLTGFSATIFFVIPFVMTHLDKLDSLPPFKQLRILCAGVWHNIFLALIAAVVATTLPWLLFPFFDFGTGVQIESIKYGAPISGKGGLDVGDKITHLNTCPIRGSTSWQDCLLQILHEPSFGYCVSDGFIKENDESVPAKHVSESVVECCGSNSPRHLCFEYISSEEEPLPLPQHSCLLVRKITDVSTKHCSSSADCPFSLHCFRPSLENSTKLIQIHRTNGETVLFLGHPAEIYHSLSVTDFIQLFNYFPSKIPDAITKLCQFITIFSSGLAIINIIPCFYFDGQHILYTLIEIALINKVPMASVRHAISLCITVFGTLMLIIYIVVMLISVV